MRDSSDFPGLAAAKSGFYTGLVRWEATAAALFLNDPKNRTLGLAGVNQMMLKEYYGGLWLLENSYLTHTHTSFKLGFPRLRKLQQLLAMHISDSKYTAYHCLQFGLCAGHMRRVQSPSQNAATRHRLHSRSWRLLLARLSALAPIAAQRGNTTTSNQQIISLAAFAWAHYRRSIGTRGGAQASAAD
ncbi:hypothetical protein T492DRAFT_862604 [Pavlovales sp. CCMP2436]|nr:hypothetical protein T492DRAFT_862604 [Pavlovales sp. CCMP2436]